LLKLLQVNQVLIPQTPLLFPLPIYDFRPALSPQPVGHLKQEFFSIPLTTGHPASDLPLERT
jgi:hypothetical protein